MKKTIVIILVAFSFITLFGSCMTMHGAHAGESYAQDSHFGCKMHPEVYSVSPGKCPKCGMDLVYVPAGEGSSHGSSHSGGCH